MPCVWSRRSLLAALLVGSVTTLAGCRVRLESDRPRTPHLPTRVPMPDEQALLRAHRDAVRLQEMAAGLESASTPLTVLLANVHRVQDGVFESVLRAGGVPPAEITVTPKATPAATPAATGTAGGATSAPALSPSGLSELIAAEAEGFSAQALSDLTGISRDRVALIGSMTAQRAAAVTLLGGQLPPDGTLPGAVPGTAGGTLTGPVGEVAAIQLDAVRSAVYGFEVVAAQTDARHRSTAAKTLGALRTTASELEGLAGSAAKPKPLGYALPFPVGTPAAALKLATHLMTTLLEAIASQLPAVAGDATDLTGTVQVLTDISVDAVAWQVPLAAFPGLAHP
jgi:hypothetical protein